VKQDGRASGLTRYVILPFCNVLEGPVPLSDGERLLELLANDEHHRHTHKLMQTYVSSIWFGPITNASPCARSPPPLTGHYDSLISRAQRLCARPDFTRRTGPGTESLTNTTIVSRRSRGCGGAYSEHNRIVLGHRVTWPRPCESPNHLMYITLVHSRPLIGPWRAGENAATIMRPTSESQGRRQDPEH
jgi:hypothetical protein